MSYSEALKYAEEVEAGIDRELARRDAEATRYEILCEETYKELREGAKAFFDSEECKIDEAHKQAFYKYLRKSFDYDNTLEYLLRGLDWIVDDFLEGYIENFSEEDAEKICEMFDPIR